MFFYFFPSFFPLKIKIIKNKVVYLHPTRGLTNESTMRGRGHEDQGGLYTNGTGPRTPFVSTASEKAFMDVIILCYQNFATFESVHKDKAKRRPDNRDEREV